MEVGGKEVIILYLSLHCRHQNESCIKMGSDESHFNVSLIVRDRSRDSVHGPQHLKGKEKTLDLWGFVTTKSCYYGWKHEFCDSWIWGVGEVNPVLWQPDTSQHHKIGFIINQRPTVAFSTKESMKRVIQNFWQKKKRNMFFTSKIFHMTNTVCVVKPSLWASASPYFDSVCSRQCRRHLDTHSLLLIIDFNHYDQ